MIRRELDVLVLGAGLQGAGISLELASRGVASTLIDQDPCAIHRASLRNEGKIHLGIIYANDPSLDTAFLQLDGALRFRRTLTRWMPHQADWLVLSTPFHYLVASDSVVTPQSLATHYESVGERCRVKLASDPSLDYLGVRPDQLVRPLSAPALAAHFEPSRFVAAFDTVERAIDTEAMAVALRQAVHDHPLITFRPSHHVRSIVESAGALQVEGDGPQGPWQWSARQVVNAMWEQRLHFDQQLGRLPLQ